jgi:RNase P subunit RPR2
VTLICLQPEEGFTPFWPFRLLCRITPSLTPLDKTCYGLPRCATRYHALATWVYGAGRAAVPSGEARLSNPAASHLHGTQHGAWTAGGSKRGIAGRNKKASRRLRVRLANDFKDQKCARCFQPLHHGSTIDAVYENGEWYHRRCLEEGKRQFAEAQKQSHLAEDSPPASSRRPSEQ